MRESDDEVVLEAVDAKPFLFGPVDNGKFWFEYKDNEEMTLGMLIYHIYIIYTWLIISNTMKKLLFFCYYFLFYLLLIAMIKIMLTHKLFCMLIYGIIFYDLFIYLFNLKRWYS